MVFVQMFQFDYIAQMKFVGIILIFTLISCSSRKSDLKVRTDFNFGGSQTEIIIVGNQDISSESLGNYVDTSNLILISKEHGIKISEPEGIEKNEKVLANFTQTKAAHHLMKKEAIKPSPFREYRKWRDKSLAGKILVVVGFVIILGLGVLLVVAASGFTT